MSLTWFLWIFDIHKNRIQASKNFLQIDTTCSSIKFAGGDEADYIQSIANLSLTNRIQNFSVQIVQDDFTELNETFSVVLSLVFLSVSYVGPGIDLSDQERARLILNPDAARSRRVTVNILDDDGY